MAEASRIEARLAAAACAIVAAVAAALAIVRHLTFHSNVYDLGIFHQVLWNTAHGRFFESSLKHFNYLGDHFSPSFGLLAPLLWLPAPVFVLLALQAAAVGWAGWNVFQLARGQAAIARFAPILGIATALHPLAWPATLFDLHPEPFMAAALSRALLECGRDRLVAAAIWFGLVLTGKEDAPLLVAPIGLALAFEPGRRRFGLGLAATSLVWLALVMAVLMPALRPPPIPGAQWFYLARYGHLGASPFEIARHCLLHPLDAIARSATPDKWRALIWMLGAVAFAPLLGGVRLLALLPFAAAHFLSLRESQFTMNHQYLVPLAVGLAWAAAAGLRHVPARAPRLVFLALAIGFGGQAAGSRVSQGDFLRRPQHAALREAVRLVPDGAPACAQNRLGAWLTARRDFELCVIWEIERPQYRYFGWPDVSSARYQLFDLNGDDHAPGSPARLAALRAAGARVLLDRDGVTLIEADEAVIARAADRK